MKNEGDAMRKSTRRSWVGLVTLLLTIILFVPVEASSPPLAAEKPVDTAQSVSCGSSIGIGPGPTITSYGECNDVNCCGGNWEAPCKRAAY